MTLLALPALLTPLMYAACLLAAARWRCGPASGRGSNWCDRRLFGKLLKLLPCLRAELRLQHSQIAAHFQLPTMLVDDLEIHRMMCRQGFDLEVGGAHHHLCSCPDIRDHGVDQAAAPENALRMNAFAKTGRILRQRHAMTTQLLRQRLDQQLDFVFQHARHQPVAAICGELIQGEQRHRQRHAVARRARLEMIGQRHLEAGHAHHFRKQVGRDAGSLMPHQIVAIQKQQLRVVCACLAQPVFKADAIVDMRRQRLVIEGGNQLVVDQHVEPARLVFQVLDFANQFLVVREERRARREITADKCIANEDLARLDRIDGTVMNPALAVDHQAVERGAFEGRHLRRAFLPTRLAERFLQQMAADFFEPFRLDLRDGAGIQARGLDQLGCHDPFAGFLQQVRAGPDMELDAARTEVMRLFVGLETDVPQQASEESQVQIVVGGWRIVQTPALLAHDRQQLGVHVAPLAQA